MLTLLIYSTLYIMRPIAGFLRENIPSVDIVSNMLFLAVLIVIFTVICKIEKSSFIIKKYIPFLIATILILYAVIIWNVKLAEEKIHFFEYGILGFLIYRALVVDVKSLWVYLLAFILVFALGWVDELIQYIVPNRYYDIRDVIMNGVGGTMGLILTFIVNIGGSGAD